MKIFSYKSVVTLNIEARNSKEADRIVESLGKEDISECISDYIDSCIESGLEYERDGSYYDIKSDFSYDVTDTGWVRE